MAGDQQDEIKKLCRGATSFWEGVKKIKTTFKKEKTAPYVMVGWQTRKKPR